MIKKYLFGNKYTQVIDTIKNEEFVYVPWYIDSDFESKLEVDGWYYDKMCVQDVIDKILKSSNGADLYEYGGKYIVELTLSAFMDDVVHCIENNPRNDNFKFNVRARDEEEELEVINHTIEYKEELLEGLRQIIGKCEVKRTEVNGRPGIIIYKI